MRSIPMIFAVMLMSMMCMGASCNTADTMDTIRSVHMGVREAGRIADEQVAPHLTEYGDTCIARAEAAGHPAGSGQAGMDYWRECMVHYDGLADATEGLRIALEELETIYNDIEAGVDRNADWNRWIVSALRHGRNIIRFCELLELDIPGTLSEQLDNLCVLAQCDEPEGGE